MPRRVRQPLTTRRVAALREKGMYCDGGGLYLRVGGETAKSWVLRTLVFGRRRDFGLGSAEFVSLKEARSKAYEMRKVARLGGNPLSLRRRELLTFEEAAKRACDSQKAKWSSDKHSLNWWSSMERYVLPMLGNRPLEAIETRDLYEVLEPIWTTKYDTAKRVRQRITLVFDWAKGAGLFQLENPANGLKKALPAVRKTVQHRPALKWSDLPEYMLKLSKRDELSARLMELTILTCVRSKEMRGIQWIEVEGDAWIVPAGRMKERLKHRVPLSRQATTILSKLRCLDDTYIFPGARRARDGTSKPMSDMVFKALMRRMGVEGITTHGFRSTFKDWCSEYAKADWELSEMALAHKVGTAVERAYARSDLFERRRGLMQEWADFAFSKVDIAIAADSKTNHLKPIRCKSDAKQTKLKLK